MIRWDTKGPPLFFCFFPSMIDVMAAILITEFFFLKSRPSDEQTEHSHSD